MDAHSHHATFARHVSLLTVMLIVSTLILAACNGDGDNDDDSGPSSDALSVAPPTAAGEMVSAADMARAPGDSSSSGDEEEADGDVRQQRQGWQQRIIRTANVTIKVIDGEGGVSSALESVRLMATAKGGYVFSSNAYTENTRQFAQITIQVPVEQFDATMNELRSAPFVEEVVREESSSQDVSEEYVDNQSRMNALRETERRFLALLAQAESIEDILRLEQELTDLRSQIETIQGRQNYLDQVTSFSTITVSLQPSGSDVTPQIADVDDGGFSLTTIAERAWDHSRGAIEAILVVTITLAIVGAAILPFALVGWFGFRIYRTRVRNATG